MKQILKSIYKKIFIRTNKQKIKYLINKGAKIGENVRIISGIDAFGSEPYLIEIGSNTFISSNVTLLTHDGGISVLNNLKFFDNNKQHERMDKLGRVKIGNNCFVGRGATVMPGVTVGDNCIIGLGSIVTKDVKNNSVVCGIPAKKIKTIEEYGESIKDKVHPTASYTSEQKRKYCETHEI